MPSLVDGGGQNGLVLIDGDDTFREVHGSAAQRDSYGYTRVRGLNLQ